MNRALASVIVIFTVFSALLAGAAPISGVLPLQSEKPRANEPPEFSDALSAFKQGKFNKALEQLRLAAQNHSELPPAEVMLANMYFSDGQENKGRQTLENAAVRFPADPEPHLIFGDLAFRERRLSDAAVQYDRAEQLLREFEGTAERKQQLVVRTLSGKANVAESQHRFEDAKDALVAQLEIVPQDPLAHFRLGNVLFALGESDQAFTEFQIAAKSSNAAPSPELTMVELYKQAGKTAEAESRLEAAVRDSPEDLQVLMAMASWQVEMRNDLQAALPLVARAAQLDPNATEVSFLQGVIAWSNHDLSKAEQLFESITLKEPENLRANNSLALVLAEQNDAKRRERAWELVQMSAASNPNSLETVAAVGCVAYLLGDLQKATQYLQAAVARGAGRDAAYYLARTLYRQGQIAQARSTLEQALAAEGMFVHLDDALRWKQELAPVKKK